MATNPVTPWDCKTESVAVRYQKMATFLVNTTKSERKK